MQNRILFLVGPTGSGKSELGVELAKSLNGEIVACDSMLVYRGMNIGTAKPSRRERQGVRHHMMDLITPRQRFSVFMYRQKSLETIKDILRRKRVPIVVGGSGLYLESLIEGLPAQSKTSPHIRRELENDCEKLGLPEMYARLKKLDPDRASEIMVHDKRRILRALEVIESLGVMPSLWRKSRLGLRGMGYDYVVYGLERHRKELYERINQRVDKMMERGFLREATKLAAKGLSRTARQAIGYAELLDYRRKKLSLDEAVSKTKQRSRNLAKKQLIWFRRKKGIHWIQVSGDNHLSTALRDIVHFWRSTMGKACDSHA